MEKVRTFCIERKLEERIFCIAWIIFLLSRLLTLTAWDYNDYATGGNMEDILQYIMLFSLVLFAVVILIKLINKNFTWKILIFYGIFFIVAAFCFLISDAKSFLAYSLIFIASYKINGKKIISISLILSVVFFVFILLSILVELNENLLFYYGTQIKNGLGFNYCTTPPILLLFIFLQYVYLRKERMKIWEYAIFEATNIVFFILCHAQFAFYVMSAAVIFFVIQTSVKKHWKILSKLKWLWVVAPFIICIFSILLHALYQTESEFWIALDNLLHTRLQLGRAGINNYGIKAFGNNIVWVGYANAADGTYNFVDCSYLQILLRSGILALILIMAVYTYIVWRGIKKNDYYLVFVTLICLVFCITEPTLLDMATNTLPILAFTLLDSKPVEYKKGWLKEIFTEDISAQEQFSL